MEKGYQNRNISLDLLKVIGLLCIILAHSNPPAIIVQIRNFDVPLMVMVSGILFSLTTKSDFSILSYIKKRIPRLILPVWIYFAFFFASSFIGLTMILHKPYPFSLDKVLGTFMLAEGIGYVWIIRVFILIAIVSPFMLKIEKKLNNNSILFVFLVLLYSFYEVLIYLTKNIHIPEFLNLTVFYILPYFCIFGLGFLISKLSDKKNLLLAGSFLLAFIAIAIFEFAKTGHFVLTQEFKYPPLLYYISYAMFVSVSLYLISKQISLPNNPFIRNKIAFISDSTMWIYLWHTYFIFIWRYMVLNYVHFKSSYLFLAEFVFLLTFGILFTYLQKKWVSKLLLIENLSPSIKNFLTYAFLK